MGEIVKGRNENGLWSFPEKGETSPGEVNAMRHFVRGIIRCKTLQDLFFIWHLKSNNYNVDELMREA